MRCNLKSIRKSKRLTQQQLATMVHIHRSYYTKIERGDRNPSLDVAIKIKEILGYKYDDIFLNTIN